MYSLQMSWNGLQKHPLVHVFRLPAAGAQCYLLADLKYFKSEDVSVGMWVHALQLHVIHDDRFNVKMPSQPGWKCSSDMLSQPKLTTSQMRLYYQQEAKGRSPCS